jgi:hypothetical protein
VTNLILPKMSEMADSTSTDVPDPPSSAGVRARRRSSVLRTEVTARHSQLVVTKKDEAVLAGSTRGGNNCCKKEGVARLNMCVFMFTSLAADLEGVILGVKTGWVWLGRLDTPELFQQCAVPFLVRH